MNTSPIPRRKGNIGEGGMMGVRVRGGGALKYD